MTQDAFELARCPCGEPVLDGMFTGAVRTRCRACSKRVWVISDGRTMRVGMVDSPPREVVASN